MARNVEIKARVRDAAALSARAAALTDAGPEHIEQDDTFFACAHGRLKLRRFSAEHGHLIHYFRADVAGPRLSDFHIVPTDAPDALRGRSPRRSAPPAASSRRAGCTSPARPASMWMPCRAWAISSSWKSCCATTSPKPTARGSPTHG